MPGGLRCVDVPGAGLGCQSEGRCKEGGELMSEFPALSVPLVAKHSCARCGRRAAEAGVEKLRRCVSCKQARYCSEGCQTQDWALHGLECGVLAGLREHGRTLEAELRAVVRVACMVARDGSGAAAMSAFVRGSLAKAAAGSGVAGLLALVHNRASMSAEDEARAGQALARLHTATAGTALAKALAVSLPAADARASEVPVALSVLTVLGASAVMRLIGLVRCNGFTAYDSSLEPCVLALYPRAARVNHSCDPTAVAAFKPSADGPVLSLRACTLLTAGSTVTISYDDPATPRARRRSRLSRAYYFHCGCARCGAIGTASRDSVSIKAHATLADMSGYAAVSSAAALLGPLPRAAAAAAAGGEGGMLWQAEAAASGLRVGSALCVPRLPEEGESDPGSAADASMASVRDGAAATAAAGGVGSAVVAPSTDTDTAAATAAAGGGSTSACFEGDEALSTRPADSPAERDADAESSQASRAEAVLRSVVDQTEAEEHRVRSVGRAAHEAKALESALAKTEGFLSPAHFERRRALTLLARLRLKAGSTDEACDAALAALALARMQYTRPCAPLAIAATFASRIAWACERPELASRLIQVHRSTLEVALGADHPAVREALLTLAECAAELRARADC